MTKPHDPLKDHRSQSRPYADGADPIKGSDIGVSALSDREATVTRSDQRTIRRSSQAAQATHFSPAGLDEPHSTSTSPINAIGLWLPLIRKKAASYPVKILADRVASQFSPASQESRRYRFEYL